MLLYCCLLKNMPHTVPVIEPEPPLWLRAQADCIDDRQSAQRQSFAGTTPVRKYIHINPIREPHDQQSELQSLRWEGAAPSGFAPTRHVTYVRGRPVVASNHLNVCRDEYSDCASKHNAGNYTCWVFANVLSANGRFVFSILSTKEVEISKDQLMQFSPWLDPPNSCTATKYVDRWSSESRDN